MYDRLIKRLFDVILSGLVLLLLSPVFLVLAVLVRVKLGTPVFFSQERPGRGEKIFRMYKFRSMTDDRDENGELLPDEKRMTRFGSMLRATSLDELPELWNICKGDMSIVGPRPLLVRYLPRYNERQRHRHDVRPGLTGWAQVNGRNAISWEQKFAYDVEYVERESFWFDVKIIFMTIGKVLRRSGIHQDGNVTMEEFMGTEQFQKKHIFLASPHMSEEGYEKFYIEDAFQKNFIAPLGENVTEFEKELGAKLGTGQGAALSSGTAAIQMALMALGIGAGDIVFTQSLTFSASANPVTYVGAEPVFIDSDFETWNMSPVALRAGLEKYKAMGRLPKAVIVVHLYGLVANMDEITAVCREYGVPLIEDAAEGLGTTYTGACTGGVPRYVGTFGDYGIFSFNGNKIITTSGGGMLFCNIADEAVAKERVDKVRFWSTQSRDPARWYQHTEIGYNFRMSNIVAGIGRGQLKVLDQRVEKKQYIYEYYKRELGDLKGLTMMPVGANTSSNCWLSAIQLSEEAPVKPLDIILALEKDDVESRPVWKPMHLQPVFADCDFVAVDAGGRLVGREAFSIIDEETGADNSVSGTLFAHGVCMPSDTKMDDADLARICSVVRALW